MAGESGSNETAGTAAAGESRAAEAIQTPARDVLPSRSENEVGLALSGGGFRAALFALGTLWRLNEGGWLRKLTHITSVSGGSITAAYLGLHWKDLAFNGNGVAENFPERIARPIEQFCRARIDVPCIIKGLLTPRVTIGDFVARAYQKRLYNLSGGRVATLQDLPGPGAGPVFVLYATNLQTGVSVRFTRESISDYRLGKLPNPDTPLAVAVGASSAFPPLLSPVRLKTDPRQWRASPQMPPKDLVRLRRKMILTDGGVYDNLGLEAIFERCGTVLVSDAGAPGEILTAPWLNWLGQLARVRAIMMEQTRALRRRMVMANLTANPRLCHGALWRIATPIDRFQLPDAMVTDNPTTAALQFVRTRLNPFNAREQGELINWGYALCDAAMRKHVDPSIGRGTWPKPEFPLSTPNVLMPAVASGLATN
ncbi:MAG: patatin-like phospholipase family protein [Pseudomonadota bacterium]|nr:patatin-like phospholipase family protein [Pseudomonadota bacterium]